MRGEIFLPGDKSIAHRSIIISAISHGITKIENFPANKDCLSTIRAFKKLGVRITKASSAVTVNGAGLLGLKKHKGSILLGDSGTTLRLILGVLAGQNFGAKLVAGQSLSQRPMLRVTKPLRMMGAVIKSKVRREKAKIEEYPPITIKGGDLKPITYRMPVASAQVKSAILLAGLYAPGITRVIEPVRTRDHTERMLELFKADIKVHKNIIVINGGRELVSPGTLTIPGDISSAAFFIVLAAIMPDSRLLIKNLGLNPLRTGIIRVLKKMGAKIQVSGVRCQVSGTEPIGDILVKSSALKGTIVRKEEIPSLIDELPILMVAAANAKGKTVFEGVSELRVKETDRIKSMFHNLKRMGAKIEISTIDHRPSTTKPIESIVIEGVKQLKGAKVRSFGDHRTAMSMVIAGLSASGKSKIDDISCIDKSFPGFLKVLKSLLK